MNKLLTTAIIGAVLSTSGFASSGQLEVKNDLAITAASATGLRGGSVKVADSGKLYVLGNGMIADGQTLSLGKGVTVKMGTGTASYSASGLTVTSADPQAAVTLNNNGSIVIDATDLTKPIKMGTIATDSEVNQGGANGLAKGKIILNLGSEKTVVYTPANLSDYSLGGAYVNTESNTKLANYQAAIANTGLANSYGTGKVTIQDLESSTGTKTESLKISGAEMLGTENDKISLAALPKIKWTGATDDFVTALQTTSTASAATFAKYGIFFSKDGTAGSLITPTYASSGNTAISVLTGNDSGKLVVLPAAVTITCNSASTVVCDVTNFTAADTYTSGIKFDGKAALTLSGNVSELKNVTVDCPLTITGTTCPSGKINGNITFGKTDETSEKKINVDLLDLSSNSSGTVTINDKVTVEAKYVIM